MGKNLLLTTLSLLICSIIASAAFAEISSELQSAIDNSKAHAASPTASWLPSDGSIITTTNTGDVYGLKYTDSPTNTKLIVRSATRSAFWGYTANAAGQTYTTYGTKGTAADWVTTGNDFTNFYDNKGGGTTNTDLIKIIERGLGMNNTGTHNIILEYVVAPGTGQVLNDVLMRATKNPILASFSNTVSKYGDPASFPAIGDTGMSDSAAYTTFQNYYAYWAGAAYNSTNNMPWTQLGYTYFWGNGDGTLAKIQGMSEFVVMAQTGVTVYGVYPTASYIYTKNDGTNLSTSNPTDQYGNGFAGFNITGACDSVWAGHRFQAKTKSNDVGGVANIITNSGTISDGQGVLVWSLNYDVTNSGIISGSTTDKCGLSNTANIAILFKGNTTSYDASVHVPTGNNVLTNSGTISSPGTAIQIDAGTTTITNTGTISGGNYAIYSSADQDTVNINGGTVNGKIDLGGGASDTLSVAASATLGFTLNRDTVSSAQVLNVADVTITDGATIAPLVGGTKNFQNNESFLIVDASNSLTATASNLSVTNDGTHPMITFSIPTTTAKQLSVVAARNNSYYKNNCGNSSLGATLDSLANTSTGDMANVIGALDGSGSASNARQLEPMADNSALQANYDTMLQFINNILSRFDNVTGASRDTTGTWAQGFDTYLHQDSRGSSNGYDANVWGTSLGFDTPLLDNSIVGIAGGYAKNNVRTKDSSARSAIDSYETSLYGSYAKDAYYLDLIASLAYNVYNSSRRVAFGGIDRKPTADYGGQQYSGYMEGGYTFKNKNVTFAPLASLQYAHLHINHYSEEGGDSIDLSVAAQDYDMLESGLGIKAAYKMTHKTLTIIPDLHFKWLYDFIGDSQQATSTFTGGGASFVTNGFDPAQSGYNFGTKLIIASKKNVTLTANYDFEIKEDFYSHAGYLNVRYDF